MIFFHPQNLDIACCAQVIIVYVLFLADRDKAVGDFVRVLQAAPPSPLHHQISSYGQSECTTGAPRASAHMYTNAVIKPTEDGKHCGGSAMKFAASKIIFLDSFDGAGILSGLIGLAD